ncbi:MAG: beta-lactamase family protein [Phenylobacterium sp.]|nr:beta-lactamase family protein [Phenylobacterium sp.]
MIDPKNLATAALAALAAATQAHAQPKWPAVDAALSPYVEKGELAGVVTYALKDGRLVHASAIGKRDLETGAPMQMDTIVRAFSMTKPVTAVAMAILYDEGKWRPEDPLAKVLPELAGLKVFKGMDADGKPILAAPAHQPTIGEVMTHTAGFSYGFNPGYVDDAYRANSPLRAESSAEALGRIATLPLAYEPGTKWQYSISMDVEGLIVERLSGQSLPLFMQSRIFGPLKMVDTGFHVRDDQRARFAACYDAVPGGGMKLQDDPQKSPYLEPPALLSGGGGLVGTAADYLRFANMLLNRGELDGARILAPKTVDLMASNHLPGGADLTQVSRSLFSESTNAGVGFGLGFAVVFDPPQTLIPCSLGEFYWGGAASTAFWVDPVEQVTAVFMTQLLPSSTYPVRRELRTLVYSALMETYG